MEPTKYFFGYAYIVRNFLLSVLPLASQTYGVQVLLLAGVFIMWLWIQVDMKPWRFDVLNWFDALNSVMQVLTLMCLGLMNGARTGNSEQLQEDIGWTVIVGFVGIMIML